MGLLKKVGKLAKTAVKAYATYQTGGLAGLAASAATKVAKKRASSAAARAMPGGAMVVGMDPGMTVQEALQQQYPAIQQTQAFFPLVAAGARAALPVVARGAATMIRAAPKTGVLAQAARGLGGLVKTVGGGVAAGLAVDALTRSGRPRRAINPRTGKPYRRMNVANARAAKRAIRRIKGVRKMLHDIERQLPKQKTHTGGYCPPPRAKKKC